MPRAPTMFSVTVAIVSFGCPSGPEIDDAASGPVDAAVPADAPMTGDVTAIDSSADAGPLAEPPPLTVPCTDSLDALYAATPDTSGAPLDLRGRIRACAYERFVPASECASRLAVVGVEGIAPITGVHSLRIAFQTTRRGDLPAVSSARVLLPATYARAPSPMLVAAHGTAGLADGCAPSRSLTQGDGLAMPFAASGWPTIAPDYAGLGTAGTQGYGDNDDTARSQLDAARALRALLPAGTLSDAVVMDGHSQGGGVVLSAQALERTYGAGGELAVVLAFAPGWPIARDVTGYRFPRIMTSIGDGAPAAIASLYLHAWHANHLGETRAGEGFGAPVRDLVVRAIESECVFDLAESIPDLAPTFGELVDETLRTGLIACSDGGACTGTAQLVWDSMAENVLHGDPAGARVVVYTGSADTLATPPEVQCIVEHLATDGVVAEVCVDGSTHFDVVAHGAAHVVAYASAVVDAEPPPGCPAMGVLPACR